MEQIASDDPREFAEGERWLRLVAFQTPQENSVYEDEYYDKAKYALAYQMELGRIDPLPAETMYKLYEAAAKSEVSEAMLATGHYLEYGIGVERNIEAATEWYLKAAECGNDEGFLLAGLLSGKDSHLEAAAESGHVAAMLIVAKRNMNQSLDMYGFDSFQTGLNYFEDAASSGNLEAVLALAEIYEDGWNGHSHWDWWMQSGLESESERLEYALGYYEQAVDLGCNSAARSVARIQKILDGDKNEAENIIDSHAKEREGN